MAGSFVTFIVPGYTSLFVRDLPYVAGTGDDADVNPFNPTDLRPLEEGEWLQLSGADKVTRGGDNVVTVAGTPDGEGTLPAFLYFQEKGRYDAQVTKRAHNVFGPSGFIFRTKMCCTTRGGALAVGDKVSVCDYDGGATLYGVTRRVLAKADGAGAWVVGTVTRIYGPDDIGVFYNPQYLA